MTLGYVVIEWADEKPALDHAGLFPTVQEALADVQKATAEAADLGMEGVRYGVATVVVEQP